MHGILRLHLNVSAEHVSCDHVWQVFAEVPEHVGFDIEVKMATPVSCPRTPQVINLPEQHVRFLHRMQSRSDHDALQLAQNWVALLH